MAFFSLGPGAPVAKSAGVLLVSPTSGLVSTGFVGGPFSPSSRLYALTNSGNATLSWAAARTQNWVGLSATNGTLAAHATTSVTVSINSNANALAVGNYSATVTFTNRTRNIGTTSRSVNLAVNGIPVLSVSPSSGLSSSGSTGGPFSPSSQLYVLTNSGSASLTWSASKAQTWASLSTTNGTLAAGATATVSVSINSNANTLAAGSYSDSVTFTNLTNGNGSTNRAVSLTAILPGILGVISGTNICHDVPGRFPQGTDFGYVNAGFTYSYTATGQNSPNAFSSLFEDADGLPDGGFLAGSTYVCPGLRVWSMVGKINGACVQLGTHGSFVAPVSGELFLVFNASDFSQNGLFAWNACLTYPPDMVSTGFTGGPFDPPSQVYTLTNSGGTALSWSINSSQNWIDVTATSGTLAGGASTNITITINTNANSLAAGVYSNHVTFANLTNGNGSTNYLVRLTLNPICGPTTVPTILTQPVSQVVCPGGSASFTVSASGSVLNYQWQESGTNLNDGANLSGTRTPTLTISNVAPATLCGTVLPDGSGQSFGTVIAGQAYSYQASGCAGINSGCGGVCTTADPSGNAFNGGACGGAPVLVSANPGFLCPSLNPFSLVGKVNGTCIQLGKSGTFVAPSSGTLVLYLNDDIYGDNTGSWNVCLVPAPAGHYAVIVSNSCASQTSSAAVLMVSSPGCMTLAVTSPPDYTYTTNGSATINGIASAATGIAGVTVNGLATTSTNAFANWTVGLAGLPVGVTPLTVIATDKAVPPNSLTNLWHVVYATGAYDGNADGLPDVWQLQHFGCVACPQAAPGADPDGDGLTNLQEFQAGSDPTLPAPAAPSNLTATAVATNQINLSWTDNSTNEDGFIIERAPDSSGSPGTWAQITTVSSNVTTFGDSGVLPTTAYWYRVHSYSVGGVSPASNQISVTTPPPVAPSNLTASAVVTNQINLSWQDNSNNEDGFAIERAPDNGGSPGSWSLIATVTTNVTTYNDPGLSAGTKYWYRVRAHNAILNSDYSNLFGITTLPPPPAAPSGLTATPLSGSQIALSWTDNATNETSFAIERAPDSSGSPGTWAQIIALPQNTITYTNLGLTANTTYWYRLRASNTGGFSPYSNQTNATTLLNVPNSWISSSSGKWETAGSWLLGVPPSVFQLGALITNDNTKTVTIDATTVSNFPGTVTISNLTVSAPSGATNTLLLTTGGSPTPLHALRGISLGSGGLLDVENSSLQVEAPPGGTAPVATATIDGTLLFQNGGLLSFNGREVQPKGGGLIAVGNVATGQMMVSAGTVVSSTINVGSLNGSQGTFTIAGTAAVRCSTLSIGLGSLATGPPGNGTGAVWMTGGELTTTNGGQPNVVNVGNGGTGQMTVSNGMVLTARIIVGTLPQSRGTLTVAGGSVTVSSLLNIGSLNGAAGAVWVTGGQLIVTNGISAAIIGGPNGNGQMTVSGGSVKSFSMIVGQLAGSQGSLIITGGTATVLSSLVVGNCATTATGQVTIASGGSLFVTNATHTAFLDVRNGTVIVDSGGLLVADRIIGTNGCGRIVHTNGGTITVTTLTLDPSLSAAGDNIPNGWKQQFGLDPFDPNLATQDPDGDGKNNLQESLAGTDPTNSAAYFHITSIVRTSNDLAVTWTTGNGQTNALQAMAGSTYDTNNYADIFIVTNTVAPTTNYLDLGAATNAPARYYRVRLVP